MQQPFNTPPSAKASFAQVWFALAFRPFFLLAPLVSLISLIVWSLVLNGQLTLSVYGGVLWWHMHEMLFGFSSAVIAGFLLTAVRNWTGLPGFSGWALAGLVMVWLLARVSFVFADVLPTTVIMLLDISFLPITAFVLTRPIVKAKRWRNLIFLPILLMMTLANILMHIAAVNHQVLLVQQAAYLMVMMVVLLMSLMAGRVFPMFTANGTGTAKVIGLPWLEKSTIGFTMAAVFVVSVPHVLPTALNTMVLALAAGLHTFRAVRWRPQVTTKVPLVWSLHLSYWCIPIGLALFALQPWATFISRPQALHSLTVGAIGLMILAMISRVSLGHTGRPLRVGKWMAAAFLAVFFAFVVRVFGVYVWQNYTQVMSVSIGFWCIGYGLFVVHYWPVLTRPRLDGMPG